MWWMMAALGSSGEPNVHPETGEKHVPMYSHKMTVLEQMLPAWPVGVPAGTDQVSCEVRLFVDAEGKVTHANSECPEPFGELVAEAGRGVVFEPVQGTPDARLSSKLAFASGTCAPTELANIPAPWLPC